MATVVELTQVQLEDEKSAYAIIGKYWVQGSEKELSLNQASIIGVGYYWDTVGKQYLNDIVVVYISGIFTAPIVVTDSYATIAGYIAANP